MAKGNPDPAYKWQPGQSGNPGGFTKEQAKKRKENRDRAMRLEEKMLKALEKDMTDNEQSIMNHIRADVLKLIHTAIEREDGKPVARVDNTSSDGTMSPSKVEIVAVSKGD